MLHDPLANALSAIKNAEARGKDNVVVKPASKIIKGVLEILKKEGYVEGYEYIDDKKGGILKISLIGAINNIGPIKPKFSVKLKEYEKFEQRYLPAKDFGVLIVSTPKGLHIHTEAKNKKLGGVLLAYVY